MMDCVTAMASYARALRDWTELDAGAREHLGSCDRCAELLASAKEMESALTVEEPVIEPDVVAASTKAEQTVSGKRLARLFLTGLGIALLAVTLIVIFSRQLAVGEATILVLIIIGFVGLLFVALRLLFRSFHHLHKRLKPGRQLSGVCLGLSEATGVSVVAIRLAFVVLALADGIGIVLYILLDLMMPMHPDDRQHLWRFRIARAWRARFGER